MGNQREIQQIAPHRCLGAVIPIAENGVEPIRKILASLDATFYTLLRPEGESADIPNLDGPDTHFGLLPGNYLIIQSGGKMWCGYDEFVEHIRSLAPYLMDALFYVGDEEDYIDEFSIQAGKLYYRRVHQGYWWPLDSFLASQGLV